MAEGELWDLYANVKAEMRRQEIPVTDNLAALLLIADLILWQIEVLAGSGEGSAPKEQKVEPQQEEEETFN